MSHTIKQGDTPTLEWQLNADLTGVGRVTMIIGMPGQTPIIRRDATVTDPVTGVVELALTDVDTKVPGSYSVEAETEEAGVILTYPNCGYETLRIVRDLG